MMQRPQPLVSVVTPVYNTEKYLEECIKSVLSQTYRNFEYIIVNNCSTDASLRIAEKYATKDNRIKIYCNERLLSMMENWNHAIGKISSESKYCKVVHADDWIFSECISEMVKLAEENPSVGLVGAYRLDEDRVDLDGLPYSSTVVSGKEVCRFLFLDRKYLFGSPTSLLYRSSFIREPNTFYNESNMHADMETCLFVLSKSDFGFVHQVLTYTRRHNESETSFARLFKTYTLGTLISLSNFGRSFLDDDEYNRVYNSCLKTHYKILSASVLREKNDKFWTFHKDELKKLGHTLSIPRLVGYKFITKYNSILDKFKISSQ